VCLAPGSKLTPLSHRDIEDMLAQRGITVSREAIRLWCIKFGAVYTRRLKRKHRGYGDTFYIATAKTTEGVSVAPSLLTLLFLFEHQLL